MLQEVTNDMAVKQTIGPWIAGVGTYSEQIKLAFALVAAIWILFEYRAKQHESRIERSAEYMKQGAAEKVVDAEIKSIVFRLTPDFLQRRDAIPKDDRRAFEAFAIANGEKLVEEVWRRLHFYKSLAICVKSGLCDADTACARFSTDIAIYFENYGPYFANYREKYQHDALQPVRQMMEEHCAESWWLRWLGWLKRLLISPR
jgi:hypothetical protein